MNWYRLLNLLLLVGVATYVVFSGHTIYEQVNHWDEIMDQWTESLAENMTDEAEFAKQYISYFSSKDFAAIKSHSSQELSKSLDDGMLEKIAKANFSEPAARIDVVGIKIFDSSDLWRGSFTFQYHFSERWLIVGVTLKRERSGPLIVEGIKMRPMNQPLQEGHKFSLRGQSKWHYFFFMAAIVVPGLIIFTLVICALTPLPKKKWLWILFISVGFIRFKFNWATGDIVFTPVSMIVLGAGYMAESPLAPIWLIVALPIGAVAFLIKRNTLMHQTDEGETYMPIEAYDGGKTASSFRTESMESPTYQCIDCGFQIEQAQFNEEELFCPECKGRLDDS